MSTSGHSSATDPTAEAPLPARDDTRKASSSPASVVADPKVFAGLLGGIMWLSIFDGLLTTAEIANGIAREANPILQAFYALSPWAALLFKTVLTGLVVIGMWRGRSSRMIVGLACATFFGYVALIAYHLGSLSGLGFI